MLMRARAGHYVEKCIRKQKQGARTYPPSWVELSRVLSLSLLVFVGTANTHINLAARANQIENQRERDTYFYTALLLLNIERDVRWREFCADTMHWWRLEHCVRLWQTNWLTHCESASWVRNSMHILRHCICIVILMDWARGLNPFSEFFDHSRCSNFMPGG